MRKDGCWFIYWDPCGLACYTFGLATVAFVDYVTVTKVVGPWLGSTTPMGIGALAPFQVLIVLIFYTYFKAATTDPGSVTCKTATAADVIPDPTDPDYVWKPRRRFCEKCQAIKPPRAHHCSTCGRCIMRMDHHCPWVNNCVGAHNMRFFLQFLLYTFLGSVNALVLLGFRLVGCWKGWWTTAGGASTTFTQVAGHTMRTYTGRHGRQLFSSASWGPPGPCTVPQVPDVIMLAVSTILALLFAIFTAAMAWDQWEGMTTNTSAIESMKGWEEEERGLREGLADYCGYPGPSWSWIIPHALRPDSRSWFSGTISDPDEYDPRDPQVRGNCCFGLLADIRGHIWNHPCLVIGLICALFLMHR